MFQFGKINFGLEVDHEAHADFIYAFDQVWWVQGAGVGQGTLVGFPFPFMSLVADDLFSLEIFVSEIFFDLLVYFVFWTVLIFAGKRAGITISLPRAFERFVSMAVLIPISILYILGLNPNNNFYLNRPFDIDIVRSEYQFIWRLVNWVAFARCVSYNREVLQIH